jgi:membrane glycosyltransferase
MTVAPSKDPNKVKAGQIGSRSRWGEQPRVLRLDALSMPQRAVVVSLVEALKAAPAATQVRTAADPEK